MGVASSTDNAHSFDAMNESDRSRGIVRLSNVVKRRINEGVLYNLKIIIRGDRATGKSNLFRRLQGMAFIADHLVTPEIAVGTLNWQNNEDGSISNEETLALASSVKVDVWDVVDKAPQFASFDGRLPSSSSSSASSGSKLNRKLPSTSTSQQLGRTKLGQADAENIDVLRDTHAVIFLISPFSRDSLDYVELKAQEVPSDVMMLLLLNFNDLVEIDPSRVRVTFQDVRSLAERLEEQPIERRRGIARSVHALEVSLLNQMGLDRVLQFLHLPFYRIQQDTLRKTLDILQQTFEKKELLLKSASGFIAKTPNQSNETLNSQSNFACNDVKSIPLSPEAAALPVPMSKDVASSVVVETSSVVKQVTRRSKPDKRNHYEKLLTAEKPMKTKDTRSFAVDEESKIRNEEEEEDGERGAMAPGLRSLKRVKKKEIDISQKVTISSASEMSLEPDILAHPATQNPPLNDKEDEANGIPAQSHLAERTDEKDEGCSDIPAQSHLIAEGASTEYRDEEVEIEEANNVTVQSQLVDEKERIEVGDIPCPEVVEVLSEANETKSYQERSEQAEGLCTKTASISVQVEGIGAVKDVAPEPQACLVVAPLQSESEDCITAEEDLNGNSVDETHSSAGDDDLNSRNHRSTESTDEDPSAVVIKEAICSEGEVSGQNVRNEDKDTDDSKNGNISHEEVPKESKESQDSASDSGDSLDDESDDDKAYSKHVEILQKEKGYKFSHNSQPTVEPVYSIDLGKLDDSFFDDNSDEDDH